MSAAREIPSPTSHAVDEASWFADPAALAAEFRTHLGRESGLDQIPGYEIHERISRGAQGIVVAGVDLERDSPVAIKFLSDGLFGSESARRRFDREVDVVASLRHPNIVGAVEFGSTDAGLPYLVMPRIDGLPLDRWATTQREAEDIRRIVSLFLRLCETVHYAHQHGVIHRDLKPSNVLVDGAGEPRILDFGLAKVISERSALSQPAASATVTQEGQFVGSLPWTSPEQLTADAQDVDVRTDIYALGILLYQGVTGQFPYPVDGALPAIVNSVMNTAPRRPSELNPAISADLEAIILKSLAKSPGGRYQTAGEFARDLGSSLSGNPIVARRERARHTMQRHVRRYQAITLVTAVLLTVVAFFYFRAVADRDRAATEAAKARASTEFLQNLLAEVDPSKRGLDVTVAELLDKAAAEIPMRFARQPEVAATLEFMLGRAYSNVGYSHKSQGHLDRAWRLRREVLGENHLSTLEAALYFACSRGPSNTDRSALLKRVISERRRQLGSAHRDTLDAEFYSVLTAIDSGGYTGEAIERLEGIVERAAASLHPGDRILHKMLTQQIAFEVEYGDVRRVEDRARAMLTMFADHPDPDYEHRMGASSCLASALFRMERFDEAERRLEYVREAKMRVLGPEHPATYTARVAWARWLIAVGRLDAAENEIQSLSGIADVALFLGGALERNYHETQALLLIAQGRSGDAIQLLETWVGRRADDLGSSHPEVKRDECLLVSALAAAGRCDEAVPRAELLLAYFADKPVAYDVYARLQLEYGECLLAGGNVNEAALILEQARRALGELFAPDHSFLIRADAAVDETKR